MRVGFGFLVCVALTLIACADDRAEKLAAQWGCDPIGGLVAISDDGAPPDWVLVGESLESSEMPAAVASLACNLATDGKAVFVGVTQYLGGDTDAETEMLASLDQMIAKGAPLIVARIGGSDLPYALRNRDRREEGWAEVLMAQVSASGASRAVLLVPQADKLAMPTLATGDGIGEPDTQPIFLTGKVVSLEAIATPVEGVVGPTIRSFRKGPNGYHGELAFNHVTRPRIAIEYPESVAADARLMGPEAAAEYEKRRAADIQTSAGAWLQSLPQDDATEPTSDMADALTVSPEVDLPEFVAE